jgi:hypothetical protein
MITDTAGNPETTTAPRRAERWWPRQSTRRGADLTKAFARCLKSAYSYSLIRRPSARTRSFALISASRRASTQTQAGGLRELVVDVGLELPQPFVETSWLGLEALRTPEPRAQGLASFYHEPSRDHNASCSFAACLLFDRHVYLLTPRCCIAAAGGGVGKNRLARWGQRA